MIPQQTDAPDLSFHLGYVVNRVRHNLKSANLAEVAGDTGISISNLRRLRAGGTPSIRTLEILAYYYSPKPQPRETVKPNESDLWNPI